MRRVGALLPATALVLALGGCADEPEEVVRTSGPLVEGFEIEPGSGLVGTVFPLGYGVGQQAVLRVDGDLPTVFEGYVRQAEELGYALDSGWNDRPARQWCSDPDDRNTDDDPKQGPFEIECRAFTTAADEDSAGLRGLAEPDSQGYILLVVQSADGTEEASPLAADGSGASVTDGEIAAALTPPEEPPVRLVEGSELISEPLPSGCATGGYSAVLAVTDDLLPVMRGYLEQFSDAGFTSEGIVGSEDEPRVFASAAGGGTLNAIGVAGEPSYVLIERCND